MDEVDKNAKIIWNYMKMNMPLHKCDIIFVLGGLNQTPAQRATELMLQGYGNYLVISGGFGKLTKHSYEKTEAETFADIALGMGVPKNKIILETKATNSSENITFTYELLKSMHLIPASVLIVVKPYFERRAYATFKQQWSDKDTEVLITSPQISYEDFFANDSPEEKKQILNVMVGDLQRIREYPKLGWQIPQDMPKDVWTAYEQLVEAGYSEFLLKQAH
jgi:uncharacterized SAM-binding protein YcdF (DUF218 family)